MVVPNLRNGLILFFFFIGTYLFCRGFFLHRNVVTTTSSCGDVETFHNIQPGGKCWTNRRYNRAVVLVIDALKYEFTVQHDESEANWANKMPIFQQLSFRYPRQTFHSRFVADSPTTTLQRLSALLTGSMPTFIDAATNFYQTSIDEDNLIKQMKLNDFRVVFMGDDTWMNLLPNVFHRSYPYPSFVVHDLHTVDDGVISHIYDELSSTDVDVIIGHFLGVDHCGHWHHQDHPKMADKLTQMNQVVKNVTQHLREGDLLVVLGDHGMTLAGDHGGDTEDETTAALFMYAPGDEPLVRSVNSVGEEKVSQIDLVPSLSLLLGLPIPFSSLGYLIEPLFISKPPQGVELIPLWMNVQQVQRYVNSSSHLLKLIPQKANQLNRLWDVLSVDFNDTLTANSLHRGAVNYLAKVQDVARSAYTVFNLPSMGLGVLHLTIAALVALYSAIKDSTGRGSGDDKETSIYNLMIALTTSVFCMGQFSNSFVVNEDRASLYLLQGLLFLVAVANRNSWPRVAISVAFMVAFRWLSPAGWICRYEQGCQVAGDDGDSMWIGVAAITVVLSVVVVHFTLKNAFGVSYSRSLSAQLIGLTYYVGAISLVAFWFLDIQDHQKLRGLGAQKNILPNISFVSFIAVQMELVLHRRFSKDRVILRLNYVLLHTIGLCLLLCIYTSPRHVPSLQLLATALMVMHLSRAVPVELQGALLLALMSNAFFATGHQNTFQQIQWKAGFIGASGANLVIPGVRVIMNTFSAHILTSFVLPAVLRLHLPRSSMVAIYVTRVTSQCIACFVLRQHLMLWAVFATRLLFAIVEIAVLIFSVSMGGSTCRNSAYWTLGHMGLLNAEVKGDVRKKQKNKN